MSTNPEQPPIPRALWHSRVQVVVFAWMALALVGLPFLGRFEAMPWLMTHFLLLGAVTNALFIWTWHFTCAILRVPTRPDRGDEIMRLVLLNAGVGAVLIGVPTESTMIIAAGAAFVLAAVVHLALAIRGWMRKALPSPYAFTASTYVAAAVMLVVGILVAVVLETVHIDEAVEPRFVLAHVVANLLGWIGIPILGTIVTLWPTMLRTRIAPHAALYGRRALPVLMGSVIAIDVFLVLGQVPFVLLGITGYATAFMLTALPMLRVMRTKPATSFATRSALAGMAWCFAALILFGFALARWGATAVEEHGGGLLVAAVAGGVLQVLLGCMAYLVPAMAAGGPARVRWRNDRADRLGGLRLTLTNVGVVLCIGAPDGARLPGVVLMAGGLLATAVAIVSTIRTPTDDEVAAAEAARPTLH